jgi:hypothetical protein
VNPPDSLVSGETVRVTARSADEPSGNLTSSPE